MRDPCYPACISGEQATPQTEKEDREREINVHKRRVEWTEKAQEKKKRDGEQNRVHSEERERNRCSPYWHHLQDTAQSKSLSVCSHYVYSNQNQKNIQDLRSTRRLLERIRDPGLTGYSVSMATKKAANLSQHAPNRAARWVHSYKMFWPFNIY